MRKCPQATELTVDVPFDSAPSVHVVAFARNYRTGLWRATCSCGWSYAGSSDAVNDYAAVHDRLGWWKS